MLWVLIISLQGYGPRSKRKWLIRVFNLKMMTPVIRRGLGWSKCTGSSVMLKVNQDKQVLMIFGTNKKNKVKGELII
jgi:hypothetical protein